MPVSYSVFECLHHMFLPNYRVKSGRTVFSGAHHKVFHVAKVGELKLSSITFSSRVLIAREFKIFPIHSVLICIYLKDFGKVGLMIF